METPEFPPNSQASKRERAKIEDKNIERVTSGEVNRRRRSLRKQFSETFVAGDLKTALRYAVIEVMLPAAKDMIVEAGAQGIEKLIFGDSRRYRGITPPPGGATGHINYNRPYAYSQHMGTSRLPSSQRAMSRLARVKHNFDEIVLDDRVEAEEVIDRLFDLVSRYESASVSDLYELVGLPFSHTDNKWGWTDLHGAGVSRTRGGYLLDLPDPRPLD